MFKREINIQIFKPVPSNHKPALASCDFMSECPCPRQSVAASNIIKKPKGTWMF